MATAVVQNSPLQFAQPASRTTIDSTVSGSGTIFTCPAATVSFIKLLGSSSSSTSANTLDFGVDANAVIHGGSMSFTSTNTGTLQSDDPSEFGQFPNTVSAADDTGLYANDYYAYNTFSGGTDKKGWFKLLPGQKMNYNYANGPVHIRYVVVEFQ